MIVQSGDQVYRIKKDGGYDLRYKVGREAHLKEMAGRPAPVKEAYRWTLGARIFWSIMFLLFMATLGASLSANYEGLVSPIVREK